MKNQMSIVVVVSIAALFVTSCTRMQSAHYVGKKVPMFESHDGVSIWKKGSDVFFVKAIDHYTAAVSTLEWDETENKFKQIDSVIVVGEIDDQLFLNVKEDGVYTIVRLTGTLDGAMVIFEVDGLKLEADIKSGLIKVREDKNASESNSVFYLDMSKRKLDKYVSENMNELFKMNSVEVILPIVEPSKKEEEEENAEKAVLEDSLPGPE